jgi:DNA processing protein
VNAELLKYQIGIEMIPKIGSVNAKRLIAYCGGVEAVFKQSKQALTKIPGIGRILADSISGQDVLGRAQREIEFIERYGIKTFFYLDANYPQRLRQCEDCPIVLFTKGNADVNLNQKKVISIIGTRSMTDYGRHICETIVAKLAQRGHNPIIISGLAYGVDVCAHKAALDNALCTAAVLGHGLDTIYPAVHGLVARDIARNGLLVSDFPSQTNFDRNNFIKRNRIIAGLSDAILVIESGDQGGSLITAELGVSYSRDVLAIPGMVGSKSSMGCNKLIKTNRAALIETVEDIEYQLGWEVPGVSAVPKQVSLFPSLNPDEQAVMDALKENGSEIIDIICHKTRLPVAKVSAILLNLEFAGLVKCKPGKLFCLT